MVAKASYAVTSWKNDNIISIGFDGRELHGDAEDESFNMEESALDAEHELLPVQGTELQLGTGIEGSNCNMVKLDLINKSFINYNSTVLCLTKITIIHKRSNQTFHFKPLPNSNKRQTFMIPCMDYDKN